MRRPRFQFLLYSDHFGSRLSNFAASTRKRQAEWNRKSLAKTPHLHPPLPVLFASHRSLRVAIVTKSHAVLFCVFQFGEVPKFLDVMHFGRWPRVIWRAVFAEKMVGKEYCTEPLPSSPISTRRRGSSEPFSFDPVRLAPAGIRQACASRFGARLLHSTEHLPKVRASQSSRGHVRHGSNLPFPSASLFCHSNSS